MKRGTHKNSMTHKSLSVLPPNAPISFFLTHDVAVHVERELCRAKSVLLCLSVRGKHHTFATKQKLVLDTVNATDLGRVSSFLRLTKADYFVFGLQKAPCVQCLRVNGLEAVQACPAQLCA